MPRNFPYSLDIRNYWLKSSRIIGSEWKQSKAIADGFVRIRWNRCHDPDLQAHCAHRLDCCNGFPECSVDTFCGIRDLSTNSDGNLPTKFSQLARRASSRRSHRATADARPVTDSGWLRDPA